MREKTIPATTVAVAPFLGDLSKLLPPSVNDRDRGAALRRTEHDLERFHGSLLPEVLGSEAEARGG